jgi:lysozyme
MQLSAPGLDLIMNSEGFRSQTYLDVAGIPTIGYGHRLLPHDSFPNGIAESQAQQLLSCDVRQSEQAVEQLVKVPLTQGQFDALTDFCFNLGAGRLASSTLLKALNCGRYDAAREQLLRWDIAAGQVCTGLKTRREAEFQLWGDTQPQQQTLPNPQPPAVADAATSSTSSLSSALR